MENIEINPFEDESTKILKDIEENRLWTRRSNGKPRNELDEELNVLMEKYRNILKESNKDKQEYMQYELGKIVAQFSNVPTAKNGFVDDSDIIRIQKSIEAKLNNLLEQYKTQKNSNNILAMIFTKGKIDYYIEDLKTIPYASNFIEEYMSNFPVNVNNDMFNSNEDIFSNNTNDLEEDLVFDKNAYNSSNFIDGINQCNTNEDIKRFIDGIVDGFKYKHDIPEKLGINATAGGGYFNHGIYDEFISDKTVICPEALLSQSYSYRITDRDYLYEFALFVKKMNLKNDSNLLPKVMEFLDSYLGFPKDPSVDYREDVLYNWACVNAEQYLSSRNIPIDPQFGDALTQIQITGEYPIIAFKGTSTAMCTERGTLAHNIMKVCGLRSFVMFGQCESRNDIGSHCWNAIADSNNNMMLIDFSNTVHSYTNGQFTGRKPFSIVIDNHDLANQMNNIGYLEMCDYHYENGKKVFDDSHRKYASGRTIEINNDLSSGNRLR